MTDVIRQLERGFVLPAGGNLLEVLRRKFPLDPVFEGEVELGRLIGFAMAQDGLRLARVVVAVVAEINDFAADFRLQPPGRLDFGNQEPPREKPARLLAETNDGCTDVMVRQAGDAWLACHLSLRCTPSERPG